MTALGNFSLSNLLVVVASRVAIVSEAKNLLSVLVSKFWNI